jgi:hypothetical protein
MKRILAIFAMAASASTLSANLITNPGFEESEMSGTLEIVNTGGSFITGWTVSGASVLMIENPYAENAGTLFFSAHGGDQHLDITGAGNTVSGAVSQTVATTVGADYTLSFWLGNQDDSDPIYPNASSVEVFLNGVSQGIFSNGADTSNDVNWALQSLNFRASSASTTVMFVSATNGDNFAGLDDVSLLAAPTNGVPEPGTYAMVGLALAGLAALRRR